MNWVEYQITKMEYVSLGRMMNQGLFPGLRRRAWSRAESLGWVDNYGETFESEGESIEDLIEEMREKLDEVMRDCQYVDEYKYNEDDRGTAIGYLEDDLNEIAALAKRLKEFIA